MRAWGLILHGGAKEIPPDQRAANRRGCLAALAAGRAVLEAGGPAVAAVEAAVRVLEDDPVFNAGSGSVANAEGELSMDAAMMDGSTLDIGAVAAIKGIRNPITAARLLLREGPTLLVGENALRFAIGHGAESCAPESMLGATDAGKCEDTVGCVALDIHGHVAAAVSTGGLPGSPPGRVGDSPLPGAGFYADDRLAAVALSGDGESIARVTLATRVMHGLEMLHPQAAAEQALTALDRVGGEAGAIVVDRHGRVGWAHRSADFAIAYATSDCRTPRVFLRKSEET